MPIELINFIALLIAALTGKSLVPGGLNILLIVENPLPNGEENKFRDALLIYMKPVPDGAKIHL